MILIVIILSAFFACIIAANSYLFQNALLWKMASCFVGLWILCMKLPSSFVVNLNALIKTVRLSCFVCFIINIMNYLELICNIDNFAVGKWFREVYAFRMKREPGENPGQYPLL